MGKQFWIGLVAGLIISGIVGGLIGISMVGKKAIVPPSELEEEVVEYLKMIKIPEAAAPATPIEQNDENLLEGGEHFGHHCAGCHDLEGDADSHFAKAFYPPVADLTSDEVQHYSDGQLKWIVDNGIRMTGMPGWEGIIDEDTQWKIVYYMRALADPTKAAQLEDELKAAGKWKVEAPSGHHHEDEEMDNDSDYSTVEPAGEHNHDQETDMPQQSRMEEGQSQHDAYLEKIGPDTINVIKEVRAVTGLGLNDAKAIVEAAPALLKENVSAAEADQIKTAFAEIGATVEIR